jgi:hypothetical protein
MVISGLTFEGFEVLNNPQLLNPNAGIDMRTIHTTTYVEKNNGNIAGRDVNINNAGENNADVNVLLEQLLSEIKLLNGKVPEQAIQTLSEESETLITEAIKEQPRKKYLGLSLEGIKEAALALKEIGEPILEIATKLSPLLGI